MEKYVLEALYKMEAPDQAVERMKKRWAAQINSPLTTLWEGWGIGSSGYGGGTYNHAWAGGALTALSGYAAGIRHYMCSQGYDYYYVHPQLGSLTSVHSVFPTAKGNIQLDIKKKPDVSEFWLTLPRGGGFLRHSKGTRAICKSNRIKRQSRLEARDQGFGCLRRRTLLLLLDPAGQMALQSLHELSKV